MFWGLGGLIFSACGFLGEGSFSGQMREFLSAEKLFEKYAKKSLKGKMERA